MSGVSVVVVDGSHGVGGGVAEALGVPHLTLASGDLAGGGDGPLAAERLIWIHSVPAGVGATAELDANGIFAEATLLLASAQAARKLAARSQATLVFVALVPARGLFEGEHGAACDMATAAMESLMRVDIGPWSNEGHRLVAVSYVGLDGHDAAARRSDQEVGERTPIHQLCSFGQLADAVRYVGSERAAYVSGTTLHVDGGWNAYSWMYPARTI